MFEKPKPVVILDRNRHTEELESKKKNEEETSAEVATDADQPIKNEEDTQPPAVIHVPPIKNEPLTPVPGINKISIPPEKVQQNDLLSQKLRARQELMIKEKEQLNSLLTRLNNKEEKSLDSQIKEQIEYFIPYYLTKEWVTKNLI